MAETTSATKPEAKPVPSPYDTPPANVVAPLHTEAEEQYLNELYAQLKPEAVVEYLKYFLARTPAHLQEDMRDLISADVATPPEPPPPEGASEAAQAAYKERQDARAKEAEDAKQRRAAREQRRAGGPGPAPVPTMPEEALDDMTVAELREVASAEQVDLSGLTLKDDIVGAIKKARRKAARAA